MVVRLAPCRFASVLLLFRFPGFVAYSQAPMSKDRLYNQPSSKFLGDTHEQHYTRNLICMPNYCVNPVFPGLMQLGENVLTLNANKTWSCPAKQLWRQAGICSRVVLGYNFALPSGMVDAEGKPVSAADLAVAQGREALKAYVAHLSGMGLELWENTEPWNANECIQSVWKMACYTHFPKCDRQDETNYLRPCSSGCKNYLSACAVQCCDEGVQCLFEHRREAPDGSVQVDQGYSKHMGPSALCTGVAATHAPSSLLIMVASALVLAAVPQWLL